MVGFEVVDDALDGSGQGGTAHQQHKQHDIWEGGRQVHHLEGTHTHRRREQGCGHRKEETETVFRRVAGRRRRHSKQK